MRAVRRHLLAGVVCLPSAVAAEDGASEAQGREALRRSWHRCLRQSFSGQPMHLNRQAAERAALAACKADEDAYVAAELAAETVGQAADGPGSAGRGIAARARAVLASVTAYVVEPITTWIGALARPARN